MFWLIFTTSIFVFLPQDNFGNWGYFYLFVSHWRNTQRDLQNLFDWRRKINYNDSDKTGNAITPGLNFIAILLQFRNTFLIDVIHNKPYF